MTHIEYTIYFTNTSPINQTSPTVIHMTYTCPDCNRTYEVPPKWCGCTPYPQSQDNYILQSEDPWKYHLISREQYDSFMGVLAVKKGKTVDELTRIEEQDRGKGYMLVCEIDESTPGEINQVILITDLTEEEYLEFAEMCD